MDTKDLVLKNSGSVFLEKIEKLVLWQRVAIVAGVFVILLAAATWFLYLPKYEQIGVQDQRLQGLEKKLATAKINAAELEKFQAKMQEAEAQFKIAMRALPEKQEIPSLLTSVSKSGQEVGLDFLLFEPKTEIKREFYAEIPVGMSIRGDYHNLASFFDKVARLSRIVNIHNINIQRGKDTRDLSTSCTAVTYKFVEPPAEKPSPAKPAGAKPGSRPDTGKSDAKTKTKPGKMDF
jgi:type IV pilus assembly protein PilO